MQKKNIKIGLVAGSLVAGMTFTASANNNIEMQLSDLDSPCSVTTDILSLNNPFNFEEVDTNKYLEMKCGEAKCGEKKKKEKEKKKTKAKEAKCGKKAKKKDKTKKKTKESTCGSGC